MRVWHSAWSWLKLIVAAESVAGNTRTGMLTRLILRKPFQVGRAAIGSLSDGSGLRARGGDKGRETVISLTSAPAPCLSPQPPALIYGRNRTAVSMHW